MSRPVNINETLTFNPTGYIGAYNMTLTNPTQGYHGSDWTSNYATINVSSTSAGYVYFTFTISDIPSNATITGVTCSVRERVNQSNRVSNASIQLYNNTTAKGSATTTSLTTTATVYNITNTGTWTVSELSNIRLRINGQRTSTNSSGSIRLYGATLSITYSIQGTEYEIISTLSTNEIDSISPAGQTYVMGGDNYELTINATDIDDFKVKDNGVDVTSSLVRHNTVAETQTFTGIPTSFDSTNSTYDSIYTGTTNNGLTAHTDTNRICVYSNTGSGVASYLYYNFDCSSIPANATITSVTCIATASVYQASTYFSAYDLQLCTGTTAKGTATTITGSGGTSATHNINGGSWTRAELDNIKIRERVVRGTSNTTSQASFSFWGATLTVQYTLPVENPYYWTYSLTNISADHTIIISDKIIEIPEEDPQYDYYPITISSINATTTPGRGTIRVVEGTNQTITIYPSDPLMTLVTDNGVDVSSQLVQHGGTIPTPTVSTASGASYGFTLNSNTGYYVSANTGVDKSAAVCRVDFDLPVRCLVTIQYINYAEATYDFGVFGNIDTTLSNTYYSAGSGGATITDSSYKLACNTSTYNTSSVQTLTYEIPSGQHYIYIKYSKDDGTSSNNDSLQWKISNIDALETNNYYTYTLSNIQAAHSLIFIFGNVTYYMVNSSSSGAKLFPAGSMVQLPGDSYRLTIVPDDYSYNVSVTDNNVNVSSQVQRKEEQVTKEGNTYTVVNFIYNLSNIQATHTIEVICTPNESLHMKINGSWVQVTKIYRKVNNVWTEVTLDSLTEPNIYIMK